MKIAILISGFTRTISHNFPKMKQIFDKYDCDYYLHLSNNESMDQYQNIKYDTNEILQLVKPTKCIIEDEVVFNKTIHINQKRMWYKINLLNKLKKYHEIHMNMEYDMVIRIRPDLYILDDDVDFTKFELTDNTVFGFKQNEYFCDEFNFGSSKTMDKYADIFLLFDNYINHVSKSTDLLKKCCVEQNIEMKHSNIKHKLLLSLCNIMAITGDSGTGKTTLMNHLEKLFTKNVLQLECDRYHKWERGDANWNKYTHLNPNANHISKMCDDVFNLKVGNDIYQVDYDHHNGKFTSPEKIGNKQNIVICGLHTLFDKKVNDLLNFKIYLDTDENLRRFWKIQRDTTKRGYSVEKIVEQIENRIEDYNKYIKPQSEESDLIIRFFTDDDFNYMNLEQDPKIYLKLSVNKTVDLLEFMHLLNIYNISYMFENTNKYTNLIFKEIPLNINAFFDYIILEYCKNYSFSNHESNYYSIIMSLIIFMLK